MAVKIGAEAGQVVLKNKYVEEFRVLDLHHDKPRQRDHAKEQNPRNPEHAPKQPVIPLCSGKQHDDCCG